MELSTLLLLLAIAACPISMGIMMRKMNKNMDDSHMKAKPDTTLDINHAEKGEGKTIK
mgnify:CR=1 FL=1